MSRPDNDQYITNIDADKFLNLFQTYLKMKVILKDFIARIRNYKAERKSPYIEFKYIFGVKSSNEMVVKLRCRGGRIQFVFLDQVRC